MKSGDRIMIAGSRDGDDAVAIRPETPSEMKARNEWRPDRPRWWLVTRTFGAGWFSVEDMVASTVRPKSNPRRTRRFLRRAALRADGLPKAQTTLQWWHRLSHMRRRKREERVGRRKPWVPSAEFCAMMADIFGYVR